MCPEWRNNFAAFLDHIGPRPEGFTLDRIDNDKGYEPGNVRWASRADQARNRRNTLFVEYQGYRLTLREWAERLGTPYRKLYLHIRGGGSLAELDLSKAEAQARGT